MAHTRRRFLKTGLAAGASLAAMGGPAPAAPPNRGGQLIAAQYPEPPVLTSALTSAGPTQAISAKIFDGLLTYDLNLAPQPQLATAWEVSPDGLTVAFKLRPGVTWHDGKPFTSADVAFSVLEVWKKHHSRGRATFANVVAAETPDPLTVVLRLSAPAPHILAALASGESQVLPRHLYEGTDVVTNPYNTKPIGTGPFRFTAWERGSHIVLERNAAYWDAAKPNLDRLIFRILPDAAGRATALETGEVQLVNGTALAYSDIARLARVPELEVRESEVHYAGTLMALDLNLDRPVFRDVRVRRAIAHAIDRDFIVNRILFGYGSVAQGPIPAELGTYATRDIPAYPFDPAKAAALLDEAGLKPGPDGVRFTITHDPAPTTDALQRTAEYLRDALGKVGIKVQIRTQDFATFVRRVYTDRDFDAVTYTASSGPDPAIGVQRFYWSKNFQRGVAFSNAAHYASAEADRLLEAAQTETDGEKRRDLYGQFQAVAQADLPRIPLVTVKTVAVTNRRLQQLIVSGDGLLANFADAFLVRA